jgi:murein L,D-transpeptidase YcbB/YkuD
MYSALFQMRFGYRFVAALAVVLSLALSGGSANAQVTAYKQAVATAAANDAALAEFYKSRNYKSIWTGRTGKDGQRRKAFLSALAKAGDHGLPVKRYDVDGLRARLKAARTGRDRGRMEVEMSRLFLQYADDMRSGVLNPRKIDSGMVRKVVHYNRLQTLQAFAKSSPAGFLKKLPPKTPEYLRLMKEKRKLEKLLGRGGFGPKVSAASLKPGATGASVVALRNRLTAMGYLKRSSTQTYDAKMQKAIQLFQRDHGLPTDGVAGKATMAEINKPAEYRLRSIIVAMERERWFNQPRGKRHILVNLTDFTAKIIDNNKVTFVTRSVVGKNEGDRRTPEFSDVMEFMIINPTWNVPRSIAIKEYLPLLKRNPNAVGHLRLVDSRGRTVNRGAVDFSQYNERTFPFNMKQPPSRGNALGLVKFMFPNKYNIYLHDTPSKNLFNRNVRAFSHGCIRLQQPFDFAYALLAKQMSNPQEYFQTILKTGRETKVDLKNPVPVHLIYRTAITKPKGGMEYRRDVYGRDAKIFNALSKAGVVLRAVRG